MDESHVPKIGLRYWIVLLLATTVGAYAGYLMTIPFGLPLGIKLIPLSAILIVIFLLESRATAPTDAWYWAAVTVIEAAGTRIANISTAHLGLDHLYLVVGLAALLGTTLAVGRSDETRLISRLQIERARPTADPTHWIGMIVVSILGAVASDLARNELQLGPAIAGAAFAAMLCGIYALFRLTRTNRLFLFWAAIAVMRAEGGCVGQIVGQQLSHGLGRGPGLAVGATLLVGLLVGLLVLWRQRPDMP